MDHPAGVEPSAPGCDGIADLHGPLRNGLALDLLAAGVLDRTGHARAHPEVVVRRVRDRIDHERRDVALDDLQLDHLTSPSCGQTVTES